MPAVDSRRKMSSAPVMTVAPQAPGHGRVFATEDELRTAFKRCHDLVYKEYAKDPAAAFDVTCLILAARLRFEDVGAPWPHRLDTPARKAAQLKSALRAAGRWLSGVGGETTLTLVPTPHFADHVAALFDGYSLRRTIERLGTDVLGTAYQAIVGATFRGELGAYFTPPNIAEFMAGMVDLQRGRVADPASGTGTLLMAAEDHGEAVVGYGNDINPRMARAARFNFALRGRPVERVLLGDGLELDRMLRSWEVGGSLDSSARDWLSATQGAFDAVFANPPFAGHERDPHNLNRIRSAEVAPGRTTSLPRTLPFLEVILAMLREGGMGAVVIPTSVLNAEAGAFRRLRKVLLEHAELVAMVGLPEAAFVHTDCGIHGALLFFRRVESPREDYPVFVDWIDNVGYDRIGRELPDSDFGAVLERFHRSLWPSANTFALRDLVAADRFDPNWLRHAKRADDSADLVSLTQYFSVRNARIGVAKLDPEQKYRCFEVADTDMRTGEVTDVFELSGAQVRAKGRLRMRLQEGDILLPNHRDSLIARGAPTGRSAVVVDADMDGAITSNRFVVLSTKLPGPVARALLNSAGVRRQLVALCRGAASLDVREKSLDAVLLPRDLMSDDHLAEIQRRAQSVAELRAALEAEAESLQGIVERPFGDSSDFRPASRQVM